MKNPKNPLFSALLIGCLAVAPAVARTDTPLPLMPYPASVEPAEGELVVRSGFELSLDGPGAPALPESTLDRFIERLQRQTGLSVSRVAGHLAHDQGPKGGATPLMLHIEQAVPRFRD